MYSKDTLQIKKYHGVSTSIVNVHGIVTYRNTGRIGAFCTSLNNVDGFLIC